MSGRIARNLAVYALYLGLAIVITWPLVRDLSTVLTGFPYGDGREMARHIWWYNHALQTGAPVFWQPALGYPDGMQGVLLWAHPQQFFPAWLLAFALPIPAAANLSILLYMALNGWAMYAAMRGLLDDRAGPALLAGLVYMAAPTFQGHLGAGHAGLMVGWAAPLTIWALIRLNARPSWRNGALAVLFFALTPGGHILQAIYVLLPVMAAFVLLQVARRDWRGLLRTVGAGAAGGAVLLIFVLPVAAETFTTPAYADEGGFVRYSSDLPAIVTPSFFHPLFGGLDYTRAVLGVNIDEGAAYVGLVAGALALIAALKQPGARYWLALALIAWVLSLGPLLKIFDQPVTITIDGYVSQIALPWALVQNIPPFSLARTPARFDFALALAIAGLAGYGVLTVRGWLARRGIGGRARGALLALALALILFEYQTFWPLPTQSAALPDAVQALAARDDVRAVFDVPWNNPVAAKDALYLQTAHQKPLIGGHVTRSTPVNPAKLALLEQTLDPALFATVGADVVIVHKHYVGELVLDRARAQLGAPNYEDDRIALFEPSAAGPLTEPLILPPEPARIERERAAYLYTPADGLTSFSGVLHGSPGRVVTLWLDGLPLHRWTLDAEPTRFDLPLPLRGGTFHTVTLALDPPCAPNLPAGLACDTVTITDARFDPLPGASTGPAAFAHGAALLAGTVSGGEAVTVRLAWQFAAPITTDDVRFVHLLDADGALVAQDDRPLGAFAAGTGWAETVSLDAPPDDYRVIAGWYRYDSPDFPRYALSGGGDALDLGAVTVGR